MRPTLCLLLGLSMTVAGAACSSSGGGSSPCTAGLQVSCPCAGGGTGVQVCRDDGSGYGDCTSCEETPGEDASIRDGASSQDASMEAPAPTDARAPTDALPDTGKHDGAGGCIYPTDDLDQSTWLQPTDGACQGNTAVTCDPTTHTMVGTACPTGQTCAVYPVTEHPDVTYTQPGRTYQWAGCIPSGATPCSFSYTPNPPNTIPPGNWTSSYTGVCQGNDALSCAMAPIVTDQSYFDLWAGTAKGYVNVVTCASDEACADNPMAPGNPDCYAAPLVACTPVANSACNGDLLLSCDGYAYQKRFDCSAQGEKCREDCSIAAGFTYQAAECRPPLPASATPCNPSTYVASCSDSQTLEDCALSAPSPTTAQPNGGAITPDCFLSGGACVCYPTTHPCDAVGCGIGSTSCQCANVSGQGPECILASDVLCDPATTPDSCMGTVVQTCIGYVASYDCSPYGLTCAVAGGHAGCVTAPATACGDAGAARSCSGNTLEACCPSTGELPVQFGQIQFPCAPGDAVALDCTKLQGTGLSCTSVTGTADCQ